MRSRPVRFLALIALAPAVLVGSAALNTNLRAFAAPKAPAVSARRGYIVGRAVRPDGSAVPSFKVHYSGFEAGKLANYNPSGYAMETIDKTVPASGGRYAVKVPSGAYRVEAYVGYHYLGRVYYFQMEPVNEPKKHDYDGLGLDKLGNGLVRNFVLKMTGKKKGASEETETVYKYAYYGGRIDLDCRQTEQILGGGHTPSTPLREAFPPSSKIHLTLTPKGKMVDGTTGRVVKATLPLGDDGKWTFNVRGIYPGVYTATATLTKPDGGTVPLHLSLTPSKWIPHGAGEYDKTVIDWHNSVTVDFKPNDVGPIPNFGVNAVTLYLGA